MNTLKQKIKAEISVSALRHNYDSIVKLVRDSGSQAQVICILKADGYGHNTEIVSDTLGSAGCRFFAVSSEGEAMEVRLLERERGREPDILILGYTFPENALQMAEENIICTAVSYEHAVQLSQALENTGKKLRMHIKLNTGMNRVGFPAVDDEDIASTCEEIKKACELDNIEICGIFTHFACADDEMLDNKTLPDGSLMTMKQLEKFNQVNDRLKEMGIDIGMRHCANSAAILALPEAYFDAVRAGVVLYGMNPNGKINPMLKPVMKLTATVGLVHSLKKGERVSYGGIFTADKDMTLATVTAGYADGYIRRYNGAEIKVNGISFRQVGRICMDQCMIDITGYEDKVKMGDEAVLFGDDDGTMIERLAQTAGTINYECTCIISKRVPRILTD